MSYLPINSIYLASEGEGVFIGTPQVFIRLQGCAIGCLNCDSVDTWDFDLGEHLSVDEIGQRVELVAPQIRRVSITGGDPLHPRFGEGVAQLIQYFKGRDYFINIEAAGTRVDHTLFDLVSFISFDVKTPSTGVKFPLTNLEILLAKYAQKSQIKAVIENDRDFEFIRQVYDDFQDRGGKEVPWCLTPAYNLGEEFPRERIMGLIDWNEKTGGFFRVITQQHKILHGPDKKQI